MYFTHTATNDFNGRVPRCVIITSAAFFSGMCLAVFIFARMPSRANSVRCLHKHIRKDNVETRVSLSSLTTPHGL